MSCHASLSLPLVSKGGGGMAEKKKYAKSGECWGPMLATRSNFTCVTDIRGLMHAAQPYLVKCVTAICRLKAGN